MYDRGRILIVDDYEPLRKSWQIACKSKGFRTETVESLEEMREMLSRYSYDAILLDVNLGAENGLDGLPYILSNAPFSKVFVLTNDTSAETAVRALAKGASGYLTKNKDQFESLQTVIDAIQEKNFAAALGTEEPHGIDWGGLGLLGESDTFKELCEKIQHVCEVDSTVLVLGESGTGKEVVARAIHKLSHRNTHRFEAINCAAIPDALLESELFGHIKGAYTDAKADRQGIFEYCNSGTLLLDEIGDMPLNLQTKLLRVLQEKRISRVGSSSSIPIDTRIIAATHQDLNQQIVNKKFREDLYYRLSVVFIHVPPLRDRKSDIPILLKNFLEKFNERFYKQVEEPTPDQWRHILAYDWPGNIRELANAVERAVVLAKNNRLSLTDLLGLSRSSAKSDLAKMDGANISQQESETESLFLEGLVKLPLTDAKHAFEKFYVERAVEETRGNITAIAKKAGRYRADVYRLLDKYQINHKEARR